MFIKPGDLIKVQPRDQDLLERIKVPMFQVEQVVGDYPTVKVIQDCVVIATDGNIYPLRDFDIIYVNGTEIFGSHDLKRHS
jgi:hypothetical protein